MYKKKADEKAPMMSPRISFSNDFAESSHNNKGAYTDAPVSSDFEFSVNNYSMMSADELFSKGKILPLKPKTTTLRDELRSQVDEFSSSKPPKNPTRLRAFLGLRRPKKSVKNSQDSDE
ncbi:hypothetical protein ACS0TY_006210 [Phlomoides rotata]